MALKLRAKQIVLLISGMTLSLILAAMLSGCSKPQENQNTNTDEVKIVLPKTSEPEAGFDPMHGWGCSDHMHEPLIQSTLIKTDSDGNFENDLALDYKFSDDMKRLTFSIRDDAYFSDGQKLTSEDVAFTINTATKSIDNTADFSSIEGAEAIDANQCAINFKQPDNTILYTLSVLGIVPAHAYKDGEYGQNPIGSGRYKLDEWVKGEKATLVANDKYYGDKPNINKIIVAFAEEQTAINSAKTNDVDVAFTNSEFANTQIDGYKLQNYRSVDCRGISMPTSTSISNQTFEEKEYKVGNEILGRNEVREAISYAIDKQKLVNEVLAGYGTVANSVCDSQAWSTNFTTTFDRQKSKEIMQNSGWTLDGGIFKQENLKASFTLYYESSDSLRRSIANNVATQLKDCGFEVNLVGTNWDEIYEHQYSDAVLWGWGTSSPIELYNILKSDGAYNFSQFKNDEVDSLLNAAKSTSNKQEELNFLKKAQTEVNESDANPWVWLCNIDHLYFVKDNLKIAKQKIHPHGHGWTLLDNCDKWTWE